MEADEQEAEIESVAVSRSLSASTLGGDNPVELATPSQHENRILAYRLRQIASKTVVSFGPNDPEDPRQWSWGKKFYVLLVAVMGVLNSTLGASLPSGAVSFLAEDYGIETKELLALPISLFLVGYVCGPLICGPLSEAYGRKPVTVVAFTCFILLTLGCALTQSWESLLVLRFFVGVVASAPIAVVGGLLADIYDDPAERGRAMTYSMTATTIGPVVGPAISGFISVVSWRWAFWVALIFAGVTFPLIIFMPESYEPVILKKRARKLRKETGNNNIVAPAELEKHSIKRTITVTLTRPIRMMIYELIVLFSCLYLCLVYAIFFLYFQVYPVIFRDMYGMSAGVSGLMFFPIGVGALVSCAMFFWWDSYHRRAEARGVPWAKIEEYRRLPLACIGGPLYVVSLFWIGWTARSSIHWAVPMMSGVLFGTGYMLLFIAILNYLTDAYETFSASAHSASSCSRSVFGAAVPIAASPMFSTLGVSWACSLLAFVSLAMSVIPFVFIKYGQRIRDGSKFCQHLKRLREERRREEEAAGFGSQISPPADEEKGQMSYGMRKTQSHASAVP